ncbi:hypothetical protein [Micropruina sp.]|uniref:hypothetical protein n=1 Tax=Micropruina sp. TaxID=2737536 RepID=UPI0039E3E09A
MTTVPATGEPTWYPGHPGYQGYVGYEYLTVTADHDLESLYKDTYRSFGWLVERRTTSIRKVGSVAIGLKRDRNLRNRPLLTALQRTAEKALATISHLEKSRTTAATATALAFGVAGSALLAGSVFAIGAGLWAFSIPVGAAGLICWLAIRLAHRCVEARRVARTAPMIDQQYAIVREASEQAARLRR